MDPLIGYGLISGIGSLGASLFNTFQGQQQSKELMDYQYKLQQEAIDRQNLYNSPQQQVKRLVEAQLSPNLVYGSGVDGNQSSAASPGIAHKQAQMANPFQDLGEAYRQSRLLEMEQIKNRNEAFESRERQLNLRAKTLGQMLDNKYNDATLQTRIKRQAAGLVQDLERNDYLAQQTNNAVIQAGVLKQQADLLAAKEKLTTEQALTEIIKRRLYASEILVNGKRISFMDSGIKLNNAKIKQIGALIENINWGTSLRQLEFLIKDLGWESSKALQEYLRDHPNVQLMDALIDKLLNKYGAVVGNAKETADLVTF